jgi:hypothetical protein
VQTPNFFALPQLLAQPRQNRLEPLVDYTKSIIMTSEHYILAMEDKAARKEAVQQEKENRLLEAERTRQIKSTERMRVQLLKVERLQDRAVRKAFNDQWLAAAVARAGEELHRRIKSSTPPPPGAYTGKFVWFCPEICRRNQAIVMARRRAYKARSPPNQSL